MRLSADFRVGAYLRALDAEGIAAYVRRRGDAQAGAVVVVVATLDGRSQVHGLIYGPDGDPVWSQVYEGPEAEASNYICRAVERDTDLWVVEIEDRAGRALLDLNIL